MSPSIEVASRHTRREKLEARHPGAALVDLTSRAPAPWVRFSPFFPHGEIPVPLSPGIVGASVEGIWQALKVFETADVDPTRLEVTTMRGLRAATGLNSHAEARLGGPVDVVARRSQYAGYSFGLAPS